MCEYARKIVAGRKAITTPGTPEKLSNVSIECFMVWLSADIGNTNPVVVGDANIVATPGSQKGVVLVPGNPPVMFLVRDLSNIYMDGQTAGDAVCFVYFQA